MLLLQSSGNGTLDMIMNQVVMPMVGLIPKLIGAIVVVVVGMIIAKAVAKAVEAVLSKSGLDSIKDKLEEIDMVRSANLEIMPSTFFSKVFYYMILLFIGLVATSILDVKEISQLITDLITLIPNLIVALVVLIIGILLAEAIKNIVHTTCKSLAIPAAKIIASFVFFFVFVNALMIALQKATIPTDFLTDNLTVVLAGIVVAFAIGYGLASKKTMENYMASFYTKSKFEIGQSISVDGQTGEIIEMDNTSLVLFSEGSRIIIPLSVLTSNYVEIHD